MNSVLRGRQATQGNVNKPDADEGLLPRLIRNVAPYGQSNKTDSRHYADQASLYSAERMRKVAWTRQQLDGRIESQTRLEYKPCAASQ